MSEDMLIYLCIGGVVVLAVLVILLANWADNRRKKKMGKKLMEDQAKGNYDPAKKYFGDQGKWEPGGEPGQTDWNNYDKN